MDRGERLFYNYQKNHKTSSLFFSLRDSLQNLSAREYGSFMKLAITNNDHLLKNYIEKNDSRFVAFLINNPEYLTKDDMFEKVTEKSLIETAILNEIIRIMSTKTNQDGINLFDRTNWNEGQSHNLFIKYIKQNSLLKPEQYLKYADAKILKEILLTNHNDSLSLYIRENEKLMKKIFGSYSVSQLDAMKLGFLYKNTEEVCYTSKTFIKIYYEYVLNGKIPNDISKEEFEELIPFLKEFEKNFQYSSVLKAFYDVAERNSDCFLLARGKLLENEELYNKILIQLKEHYRYATTDPCAPIEKYAYYMDEILQRCQFLEDKNFVEKLSKDLPEIVLIAKCELDENIILECLNKIDSRLMDTLEHKLTTDIHHFSDATLYSNPVIMKYLIEKNGQYFNFVKPPLTEDRTLYDLAVKNGFVLDAKIASPELYESNILMEQFLENNKGKDEIISKLIKKIGKSNILFIKNKALLDNKVIETIGFDNVSKIIKYLEVPNVIPSFDKLIENHGIENIYSLYKTLNELSFPKEEEVFDLKLFAKIVTKINAREDLFTDKNAFDCFKDNPISMFKYFMTNAFDDKSKEEIISYPNMMISKIKEALQDNDSHKLSNVIIDILGMDIYEYDSYFNKYSSCSRKVSQMYESVPTAFHLIADKLKERDISSEDLAAKKEHYINIAKMLDENLEVYNELALCFEPETTNYGKAILGILEGKYDSNLILRYISATIGFEHKAKELYSYEYDTCYTRIDDIKKTSEIDGVEIRELLGEPYSLPLHTRGFAQKASAVDLQESDTGKAYLCWSLASSEFPGHARGDGITFVYGNVSKDELLLAAPNDIYSTGTTDNSLDITASYASRFLPSEYMGKYCLQLFNELVSVRGSKPTAIFVEEKENITKDMLRLAKEEHIPIVVQNEKLYRKNHLEKLQQLSNNVMDNPTGKEVEDFLYLGMSYMTAYGGEIAQKRLREFNDHHITTVFDNLIDKIGTKPVIEEEDKKILDVTAMFINNCIIMKSDKEYSEDFVSWQAHRVKNAMLDKLQQYAHLKDIAIWGTSYLEEDMAKSK